MVARIVRVRQPVEAFDCPPELMESRYTVPREEMLWREYDSLARRGDTQALGGSMRVLGVIRKEN